MIAVLMMYRNEEDIIGQCIEHWAGLGVDEFFLCDNNSTDKSHKIAVSTLAKCGKQGYRLNAYEDNFPQRYIINYLKTKALEAGHQWLFPIDADEFLNVGDAGFTCIEEWLKRQLDYWFMQGPTYGQYEYKNIMPNGVSWLEPEHKKCYGRFSPDWNISIGNHEVEGVKALFPHYGVYLNHYQYRSYDQFKRKKITFFKAFEKAGYLDHKFVKEYRLYQKHGEAYLEQMWDYLLRGVTEFEFKPHAQ
jgi:glycosyltransferase involved in cell wall biosynthesis